MVTFFEIRRSNVASVLSPPSVDDALLSFTVSVVVAWSSPGNIGVVSWKLPVRHGVKWKGLTAPRTTTYITLSFLFQRTTSRTFNPSVCLYKAKLQNSKSASASETRFEPTEPDRYPNSAHFLRTFFHFLSFKSGKIQFFVSK